MGCLDLLRFHWLKALVCLCLFAAPACAQDSSAQDSSQAAPGNAKPGDVNVQVSRVYTFVDKTGLGHQHAIEGALLSGNLLLGENVSAGQLVFDMRSFDADTPMARQYIGLSGTTDSSTRSKVNANMKGPDVLNVGQFPTATFDVESAIATGQKSGGSLPMYKLTGKFTLHGTTQPISIVVEVEQARGWLHVKGSFVVKQTAFGITPFSKAFGAIGVTDALRIHGDLWVAPNARISMNAIPERK